MGMFCVQCEQTLRTDKYTGCQLRKGMCGKEASTAALQDLLIYQLQGISQYAHRARALGAIDNQVDAFIPPAFFTTLTNVNFDNARFQPLIQQAAQIRDRAKALYEKACAAQGVAAEQLSGPASFQPAADIDALVAQADIAAVNRDLDKVGADIIGLRCLVLYGLKGCAAYGEHAQVLGQESEGVYAEFHRLLDFLASDPTDVSALLKAAMDVGQLNLQVMELLDKGATTRFGHPEISQVRVTPVRGKAILVSGHDMVDLEAILQQTEGTGINVYTHGELLPANSYPGLKKYKHLVGNYGGAWQEQQTEFAAFPGAILMTSNCIIDPNVGNYADRIFTSGPVGWPGVKHIQNRDYSEVIAKAQAMPGFDHDQIEQFITTGFGRNTVLSVADKVVDAVKSGALKHFFLIGGCDGAAPGRNYYTDFAHAAPQDTAILTLGCGKFRFNKTVGGDIGGIPRVLDIGQCNDTYSAIQIAAALANAFECGINDLPLTLVLSWFEQKAAAVLLTLLSLGVKGIHIGPRLPGFLTPNLIAVLQDQFGLVAIGDAQQDMDRILNAAA